MINYKKELDGIRAIALLMVIFYHYGFSIAKGGYLGVDIFFVLSGYLITSILNKNLTSYNFSIINFYQRRVLRLFPAFILVLIITSFLAVDTLNNNSLEKFTNSFISSILFYSNFYYWQNFGYFGPISTQEYLLHTWSLSIEMQFYITFPILLTILYKYFKPNLKQILIILTFLSFLLAEYASLFHPVANFYLLPTRIWEFFVGSLMFLYQKKNVPFVSPLLSWAGLFLIFFSVVFFDGTINAPNHFTIVPIIGTVLLIINIGENDRLKSILCSKVLRYLGIISYSAYLWHQPLAVYFRLKFGEFNDKWYLVLVLFFLTLFLAAITYILVEKPTRNLSFKNGLKKIEPSFATLFFGLLLIPLHLFFIGYNIKNTSKEEIALLSSIHRNDSKNCNNKIDQCLKLDLDYKNIFLIGDSNAYHFEKIVQNMSQDLNYKFINITYGGCLPLTKYRRIDLNKNWNTKCYSIAKSLEERFSNKSNDDVIIVSAAWLVYLYGKEYFYKEFSKKILVPLSPINIFNEKIMFEDKLSSFEKYLDNLLRVLNNYTSKVIFVGPMPPGMFNEKKKLYRQINTSYDIEKFKKYNEHFHNLVFKLKNKYNFEYIDLKKSICKSGRCYAKLNGKFIYSDPLHFSNHGQKVVLQDQLQLKINKFLNYEN